MTQSTQPQSTAVPLSMVARGETVIIRQINGGGRLRQRLFDLGLNQGASVRVVQNELTGPMIVAVKEDSRLALGRGMTHHILVTPVN